MYKDSLGFGMAIFVYLIMLLGNSIYIYVVVVPHLKNKEEYIDADQEGPVEQETPNDAKFMRIIIEWIIYEIFSFMMWWSHVSTMCTDPGFIPFRYKYNTDYLTKPFKVIEEGDMTGKELK